MVTLEIIAVALGFGLAAMPLWIALLGTAARKEQAGGDNDKRAYGGGTGRGIQDPGGTDDGGADGEGIRHGGD